MGSVNGAAKAMFLHPLMLLAFPAPYGEPVGARDVSLPFETYGLFCMRSAQPDLSGFNKLIFVSHHGTNMQPQGECCVRCGRDRLLLRLL